MHRGYRLLLMVGMCAATACGESPTVVKLLSGVRVLSSPSAGDTIDAVLSEPLVVTLADSNGAALVGRLVRFEGVARTDDPTQRQAYVASVGSSTFREVVYDTTDLHGYASVRVQLGRSAGTASVFVRDPEFGSETTARFPVKAGAVVALTVQPSDSAAYVDQGYALRSTLRDRGGNARGGSAINFSVVTGPVTVEGNTGVLKATAFGRATLRAQSGSLSATAFTSVVPRGVLAAGYLGYPASIDLVQLDGSAVQPLTGGAEPQSVSEWGFGWSPDGRDLAIARGDSVYLVTPGVAGRVMLVRGKPVNLGARFSPDAQWIYFSSGSPVGLQRVRRDGSVVEKIGRPLNYSESAVRPSPSPDNKSVVYINNYTTCPDQAAVKVLDLATGADRLFDGFDHVVCAPNAVWSPVSDLIAYSTGVEVGVIKSDGTGRRVLSADTLRASKLEFSPDGRWLLVFPGGAPALILDTQSSLRIPVPALARYGLAAWRP